MASDDYEAAAKKLGQIGGEMRTVTEGELLELGHFAVALISARTKKGLDVEGKPFVPYSAAYAEHKFHGGKKRREFVAAVFKAAKSRAGALKRVGIALKKHGDHSASFTHAKNQARKAEARLVKATAALKGFDASKTVDLAVTGHMLGSIVPAVSPGEVVLSFMGADMAKRAAAHNDGVDKRVNVKASTRAKTAMASWKKARKKKADYRRKVSHVRAFKRQQKLPKREFFDLRSDAEIAALGEILGRDITLRVEKVANK